MAKRGATKAVYFTHLKLDNVKTFASGQELLLMDGDGCPSRWTLILGDNGVGKTTLLQCVALTRPILAIGVRKRTTTGKPDLIRPVVVDEENAVLESLARADSEGRIVLEAGLISGHLLGAEPRDTAKRFTTKFGFEMADDGISRPQEHKERRFPSFVEPLVVGYGAARHASWNRSPELTPEPEHSPTASLFDPTLVLADPDSILSSLEYSSLKGIAGAGRLLNRLKETLAKLLPDIGDPSAITLYGPASPANTGKSGVQVRTPYAEVPIKSLSLGYQTMTAWAVDLAWRLFAQYPDSNDPLSEPAIVLIDEIDLHLHPRWQRRLRTVLSHFFPNVQFIATAHSPLMAQAYLDANLVLVSRPEDHKSAVIENDPAVVRTWRIDEVITSELFGLASAYPPETDPFFKRRAELQSKPRLNSQERDELKEIQDKIMQISYDGSHTDKQTANALTRAADFLKHNK